MHENLFQTRMPRVLAPGGPQNAIRSSPATPNAANALHSGAAAGHKMRYVRRRRARMRHTPRVTADAARQFRDASIAGGPASDVQYVISSPEEGGMEAPTFHECLRRHPRKSATFFFAAIYNGFGRLRGSMSDFLRTGSGFADAFLVKILLLFA